MVSAINRHAAFAPVFYLVVRVCVYVDSRVKNIILFYIFNECRGVVTLMSQLSYVVLIKYCANKYWPVELLFCIA